MESTGLAVDQDPMASSPIFYELNEQPAAEKNGSIKKAGERLGDEDKYLSLPRSGDVEDSTHAALGFSSRDAHVKRMIRGREKEYSRLKKSRVFCGTWNVNGKSASEDLSPWLKHAIDGAPEIIALGFQELDLSKEVYVFVGSPREEEWRKAAESAVSRISTDVQYETVKVIRMVGVMLILFVSKSLMNHVTKVAANQVPTGIMGLLGNKGGVAIRFQIHSTNICFVSSHLAAHMEEYERRNQDFRDINQRMNFNLADVDGGGTISDHDMVFWLGDLNYRIGNIDLQLVKDYIKQGELDKLLANDQLSLQRKAKKVFKKYQEAVIKFKPTYKYDVGSDEFDSSEKSRCPAWTDRILFYGTHIKSVHYDSHMELLLSDHKPVSCTFDVGIKIVDQSKYRCVYEDVMKMLDKLENEYLPQVKMDKLELHFGVIKFMEPCTQTIVLTNTGQVPADFSFIAKLDDPKYCKDWLSIKPYRECVLPDESIEIEFVLYVDEKTAAGLNAGQDCLDDILVLHLEGGKDCFVTVDADYTCSCFGSSLKTLIQLIPPMGELKKEDVIKMESSEASAEILHTAPPLPVPKELWFLCDNINSKGKREEDLFQQRGLHSEVVEIIQALDTKLDNSSLPGTIHSVAEALLIFLDSLRDPVIPFSHYEKALSSADDKFKCIDVISSLPSVHKKVFEYLIEFMIELLNHSAMNNLDVDVMVNVFGPVLIRPDSPVEPTKSEKITLKQRKATFLKQFLLSDGTGL